MQPQLASLLLKRCNLVQDVRNVHILGNIHMELVPTPLNSMNLSSEFTLRYVSSLLE